MLMEIIASIIVAFAILFGFYLILSVIIFPIGGALDAIDTKMKLDRMDDDFKVK